MSDNQTPPYTMGLRCLESISQTLLLGSALFIVVCSPEPGQVIMAFGRGLYYSESAPSSMLARLFNGYQLWAGSGPGVG